MGPFFSEQPWGGIRALRVPGTLAPLGSRRFLSLCVQTGASGLLSLHSSPAARVCSQHLGLSPLSPALPRVEGQQVIHRRPPLSLQAETGPRVQLPANPPPAAPAGTHRPQPPGRAGVSRSKGHRGTVRPHRSNPPQGHRASQDKPPSPPRRCSNKGRADPSDPHAHPGGHSALTGSGGAPSRTSRPPRSELSSPRSDPRSSKELASRS